MSPNLLGWPLRRWFSKLSHRPILILIWWPMYKALRAASQRDKKVCDKRSQIMGAIRSSGNRSTEMRLRFAFVGLGIRGWQLHQRSVLGRPDFFFPKQRLAVFVDGCFWHGCKMCYRQPRSNCLFWKRKLALTIQRDRFVSLTLRCQGVKEVRFWEHEVRTDLMGCVKTVQLSLRPSV